MRTALLQLALLAAACGDPGEPAVPPTGGGDLRVLGVQVLEDEWAAGLPPDTYGGAGNGAIDAGERVLLSLELSVQAGARSVQVDHPGVTLVSGGSQVGDPVELALAPEAVGPVAVNVSVDGAGGAQFGLRVHGVDRPVLAGAAEVIGALLPAARASVRVRLRPGAHDAGSLAVRLESASAALAVVVPDAQFALPQDEVAATFEVEVAPQAPPGAACLDLRSELRLAQGDYAFAERFCVTVEAGEPVAQGPDLVLFEDRLRADIVLDQVRFDATSCGLLEGCVQAAGVRRLLRFDVSTANIGTQDLVVGRPEDAPGEFVYSECHDHHHFADFAVYSLERADGSVAAAGHKQAFCLEDTAVYPPAGADPGVGGDQVYSCDNQGISRGWFDAYPSDLDCQWVDVTDVPPGDYRLRVRINPEGDLPETDLTNNEVFVDVSLPEAVDLSAPCPDPPDLMSDRTDRRRNCGWTLAEAADCDPGSVVRLGCAGVPTFGPGCAQGRCVGDPMLRVCAGEGDTARCFDGTSEQSADDSCRSFCPSLRFVCPREGRYTAWTASKQVAQQAFTVCELAAEAGSISDVCEPGVAYSGGYRQSCGWRARLPGVACVPGARYRVGCDAALGPECVADPLLRVCPGDSECAPRHALGLADATCPETTVTCPPAGTLSVWSAAPDGGVIEAACEVSLTPAG